MAIHPQAGQKAPASVLIDTEALLDAYAALSPDPKERSQRVSFGTSGHRGCALDCSFNRDHILAISQAVCEYRAGAGISGPLYIGIDSHALSRPALITTIEVLVANGVETVVQEGGGFTPTPVISRAILCHEGPEQADGIVITPSHNPPRDGGFKYNPPHGGPAGTEITNQIQDRANALLEASNEGVKHLPYEEAVKQSNYKEIDFVMPYVEDLAAVIDIDVIRSANLRMGVDPMGGSNIEYWRAIASHYNLNIEIVNEDIDPTFSFMTLDKDGKIRMDCSSPYAMAGLIDLKEKYDIAFGNDTDSDRHGIVTPSVGLMNPNHYLAVAINYLFGHRPQWPKQTAIGKTLVSSAMIDRVAASLERTLSEVPVGFKWFVDGLVDGSCGFGGEESAGASFLRHNGKVWTTDKDGIILCLLAAEITARTGKDPGQHYADLMAKFGDPVYERLDAPASPEQKDMLKKMAPEHVKADTLAGEPILAKLTRAPGNDAAIGGLKVQTKNGWFAARPSGTENIYKIYTESFLGREHLTQIQEEAKAIVNQVFES